MLSQSQLQFIYEVLAKSEQFKGEKIIGGDLSFIVDHFGDRLHFKIKKGKLLSLQIHIHGYLIY